MKKIKYVFELLLKAAEKAALYTVVGFYEAVKIVVFGLRDYDKENAEKEA